jgi:hypothetical protein
MLVNAETTFQYKTTDQRKSSVVPPSRAAIACNSKTIFLDCLALAAFSKFSRPGDGSREGPFQQVSVVW